MDIGVGGVNHISGELFSIKLMLRDGFNTLVGACGYIISNQHLAGLGYCIVKIQSWCDGSVLFRERWFEKVVVNYLVFPEV